MSAYFSTQIKFENFFKPENITDKVPPAERRVLVKAGAFIRRRAKFSIRKRKAVSAPGSPPSSHAGFLRKLIFFAYDKGSSSVVVGPMLFRASLTSGTSTVPEALEFGGILRKPSRRQYSKFGGFYIAPSETNVYAARPFMQPALDENLDVVAELWRGAI